MRRLKGTEVKESIKKMDFREWFNGLVVSSKGCLQKGHRKWLFMSDTVIVPKGHVQLTCFSWSSIRKCCPSQ